MDLSFFEGSKVLITGATGLIGKAIVKQLAAHGASVGVYALVRDAEKAKREFREISDRVQLIVSDVRSLRAEDLGIGYIIHAASRTASRDFVTNPVEVIESSVEGTKACLNFARVNPVKAFVFLSTMEVYGAPETDGTVSESSPTNLDAMNVRSSYPESKRLCENLCSAYAAEYGVPAKVVRLTQTFGEGVEYRDGRVFAEFARCAIEGRDIVLKTKGETKRNYLDIHDAVDAILTVAAYGKVGEAYNAANEETYCSIYEMAETVAREFGGGKVRVRIEESGDAEKLGYAPVLKMNLSAAKLRGLGWEPHVSLVQSYASMIGYMKTSQRT